MNTVQVKTGETKIISDSHWFGPAIRRISQKYLSCVKIVHTLAPRYWIYRGNNHKAKTNLETFSNVELSKHVEEFLCIFKMVLLFKNSRHMGVAQLAPICMNNN